MNLGLIISSIALGISLMVFASKLVEWLIRADPRVVMRMGRWLLFFLAIVSVPSLILLLIYQQWALAMTLGAGMLIVPTLLNWRAILPRRSFRPMWTEGDPLDDMRGDFGQPPGPELVRRAAIVLEDYLAHAGHPEITARIDGYQRSVTQETPPSSVQDGAISAEEALEILGLEPVPMPPRSTQLTAACCSSSIQIAAAQTISPPRSTAPRRPCWPRPPASRARRCAMAPAQHRSEPPPRANEKRRE